MDLKGAKFELQEVPDSKQELQHRSQGKGAASTNDVNHRTTKATSRSFNLKVVSLPAAVALIVAFFCTICSIIILGVSNGQLVSSWKITPTVLLSVSSTITNTAVAFLLSEGISISWWRKFFRGATIAELDRTWSVGYNIPKAILPSLWRLDKTALATLFAVLILLDGPLLQRASTIESRTTTTAVKLHLGIAERYPPGFTGSQGDVGSTINANPEFIIVLQRHQLGKDIIDSRLSGNSNCRGTCYGTVRAAGVVPDCKLHSYKEDFANSTTNDPGLVFSITYNRNQSSSPSVDISILSVRMQHGCMGQVFRQECRLKGATISYPVKIQNTSIALLPMGDRYPSYYDGGDSNTTLGAGSGPIGGVGLMLEAFYLSNATIYQIDTGDPSVPYVTYENGAQSLEYMDFTPIESSLAYNSSEPLTCQLSSWNDPTKDIINAIDEVMFRGALLVSQTKGTSLASLSGSPDYAPVPYAQPFDGTQESKQLVFSSNKLYMTISFVLMFVCIFGTAASSWGFWQLDHAVTMSPFETAKALNAPGFETVRFGAELPEIVRVLGHMEVGPHFSTGESMS